MFEAALNLWHNIPLLIRFPIEFWIGIIIMRGVVAKDITSWLEDRGLVKPGKHSIIYRGLDYIYLKSQKLFTPGRKTAIWEHFRLNHQTNNIDACQEGSCTIL